MEEASDQRILIVDDDPKVLESLSWILKKAEELDCVVHSASSAADGLDILEDESFDLVLADYKMPETDGIELLTTVRKRYPSTVRMLITGYPDIDNAKKAINRAHVHSYIEKPWDNDELTLTVSEALKRKRHREEEQITEIDRVQEALEKVEEFMSNAIDEQIFTFSFNSMLEMNKFSFYISNIKNVRISDFHVFENHYIISCVIQPKMFSDPGEVENGGDHRSG